MRGLTPSFRARSPSIALNHVFRGSFAIFTPKTSQLAKAMPYVNVSQLQSLQAYEPGKNDTSIRIC